MGGRAWKKLDEGDCEVQGLTRGWQDVGTVTKTELGGVDDRSGRRRQEQQGSVLSDASEYSC